MEKLQTITIAVDKDIAMPTPQQKRRERTKHARIKWPFDEMGIGCSFLIPEWAEVSRWQAAASKLRTEGRLPAEWKFKMLKTEQGMRVWRVQ